MMGIAKGSTHPTGYVRAPLSGATFNHVREYLALLRALSIHILAYAPRHCSVLLRRQLETCQISVSPASQLQPYRLFHNPK
jgi:hypothetical protein